MEDSIYEPVAYYHSHESSSEFSDEDRIVSEAIKLPAILFNKSGGDFKIYRPNGNRIPYDGRPFIVGYADCLILVKDYYKNQLNIDLISEFDFIQKGDFTAQEKDVLSKARFSEDLNEKFTEITKYNTMTNYFTLFN